MEQPRDGAVAHRSPPAPRRRPAARRLAERAPRASAASAGRHDRPPRRRAGPRRPRRRRCAGDRRRRAPRWPRALAVLPFEGRAPRSSGSRSTLLIAGVVARPARRATTRTRASASATASRWSAPAAPRSSRRWRSSRAARRRRRLGGARGGGGAARARRRRRLGGAAAGPGLGLRRALRHGGRRAADPGAVRRSPPASARPGPGCSALGLIRYGFVLAGWIAPALARPLPPSRRRRAVCALQVAVARRSCSRRPSCRRCPRPGSRAAFAALLAWSFAVDIAWLVRQPR